MTPDTAVDVLERLTVALKGGAVITLSGEGVLMRSGVVTPLSAVAEFDSVWEAGTRDTARAAGYTAAEVLGMTLSAYEFEQAQR
jgi:hypothetical protein